MSQITELDATTAAPECDRDVDMSIERLVPLLRQLTVEEIEAARVRLQALLDRRTDDVDCRCGCGSV